MSSFSDPQTWIFPPSGSATIPSTESPSAGFGPVSRSDKIRLEWAPADRKPHISMICANDGTTFTISPGGNPSPYTYTFTQSVNNGTSHICWLFFPGTSLGNAVTFSYQNIAGSSSSSQSITWRQSNQLAAAAAGSAGEAGQTITITATVTSPSPSPPPDPTTSTTSITSSSSSTSSTSSTSTPYANTNTNTNTNTNPNTNPTLSIGAIAGISIAATLLAALLCALGVYIILRFRRGRCVNGYSGEGRWKGADLSQSPLPPLRVQTQTQTQTQTQMGMVGTGAGAGTGTGGLPRRTIHEIQG